MSRAKLRLVAAAQPEDWKADSIAGHLDALDALVCELRHHAGELDEARSDAIANDLARRSSDLRQIVGWMRFSDDDERAATIVGGK